MKLTKLQREILAICVASQEAHNVGKPIHCAVMWRNEIDKFGPSYARYNKQMFKLLDAGIIAMRGNETVYAYIVDLEKTKELLNA